MRKILSLFALTLIFGMCFTACSKDDDDLTGTGENHAIEEPVVPELEIFTDRLVSFDEFGNVRGVNIGVELNHSAAPGVYSIQADDINAAKAIFTELVDGFEDIVTAGDDITVTLRDAEGAEQGKVLFRKAEGTEIATMTFEGFTVPEITMLRFIKTFPQFSAVTSRYRLYDIVTVPSDREGNPRGICIREYSNGTNGMIICPTSYECGYQDWRSNTCLETMKAMGKQVKALGVDKIKSRLQQAKLYSDLSKYYWSNTTKIYVVDKGHWKVRLSDGDDIYVSSWEVALSINNANNAYTYYFDANGRCW